MKSDIDLNEVTKLLDSITKEVEDSGDDVDQIKDDIESIKKEVEDSGDDVDEIKDEIKKLRKDISGATSENRFKRALKHALPDEFKLNDLAQQIVGATIVSAPFAVTGEVWTLAKDLTMSKVLLLILITILFDIILFYYTEYQKIENKKILNIVPLRIIALLTVTYSVSTMMLSVLGVFGSAVIGTVWSIKLVILVGLFANIGAGTFDLLK